MSTPQARWAHGRSSVYTSDEVAGMLSSRFEQVTKLTTHYYMGDIISPSTKSQIIRALKFSVYYYYTVNFFLFLYGFLMPLFSESPYFGGFDVRDFQMNIHRAILVGIFLLLPSIRLILVSCDAEFYQFAFALVGLELAPLIFTAWWWSAGIPFLVLFFFANVLNITVSQAYWKYQFASVVAKLEALVPPVPTKVKDHTDLNVFSTGSWFVEEFRRLWGFSKPVSDATLYDERAGVFATKEAKGISHAKAMFCAYLQALEPREQHVLWGHDEKDLWSLNPLGFLDGMLNTFVTNGAYCSAGIFLGEVCWVSWSSSGILAVICAVGTLIISFLSMRRIKAWLHEAVGVAVAEKEWLAHDVVKHAAQREEIGFEVLDVSYAGSTARTVDDDDQAGRLNIVFMWLCMTSTAEFIGESYLAKLYWNVSLESLHMMQFMTAYDFRHFHQARWEVTWAGILIKCVQTLFFSLLACVFFGSFFPPGTPTPKVLISIIGLACVTQSVMKTSEAVRFGRRILGTGRTHHHTSVSEWMIAVCVLALVTNIAVWLYMLPIMMSWDLPIGMCSSAVNRFFFPASCLGH